MIFPLLILESILNFIGKPFHREDTLKSLKESLAKESEMHFADGAIYGWNERDLGKRLPQKIIGNADPYFLATLNAYIMRERERMDGGFLATQRTCRDIINYLGEEKR